VGTNTHIENPDVVLIGSGIMSANLGALLKRLQPNLKIQLYEVTGELSQECSHGWNNAGTGHAGICELSYTPHRNEDGTLDVSKAIEIFQLFEQSKQFWASAVAAGMIDHPREFINPIPHISFVYGQQQVDFLQARFEGLSAHHFFQGMEFTTDREIIRRWAPLLVEGRDDIPLAATKLDSGTDVNFGVLASKLIHWLGQQTDCGVATNHRVVDLDQTSTGWTIHVKDLRENRSITNHARFVFIGAGGASLHLLQKSGIPEIKGYGGFPVGGQWLVCDNPQVVSRHQAKVYGQALDEAPTMAVPHLDTRVIDGKKWLLFGPFAAWTAKFLSKGGSWTDWPRSMGFNNLGPLVRVGLSNLPLVKYLIQQGMQSMTTRMKLLRTYYPEAKAEDWKLIDAGIRVQAIKKEDGKSGIVHYGTEIITNADRSVAALLGASPGASVSVSIMMDLIEACMPHLINDESGKLTLEQLIPTYREDICATDAAERYRELSRLANERLLLTDSSDMSTKCSGHNLPTNAAV
jgi:malate dehydrogenase (quinone)